MHVGEKVMGLRRDTIEAAVTAVAFALVHPELLLLEELPHPSANADAVQTQVQAQRKLFMVVSLWFGFAGPTSRDAPEGGFDAAATQVKTRLTAQWRNLTLPVGVGVEDRPGAFAGSRAPRRVPWRFTNVLGFGQFSGVVCEEVSGRAAGARADGK
jgi:hypothetical protein